jgi:hypothetical protein
MKTRELNDNENNVEADDDEDSQDDPLSASQTKFFLSELSEENVKSKSFRSKTSFKFNDSFNSSRSNIQVEGEWIPAELCQVAKSVKGSELSFQDMIPDIPEDVIHLVDLQNDNPLEYQDPENLENSMREKSASQVTEEIYTKEIEALTMNDLFDMEKDLKITYPSVAPAKVFTFA